MSGCASFYSQACGLLSSFFLLAPLAFLSATLPKTAKTRIIFPKSPARPKNKVISTWLDDHISVTEPVEVTGNAFYATNSFSALKKYKFSEQEDISREFYKVKLGKQGFALRHKMPSETSETLTAIDRALSEASDGLPALDKLLSEASDAFTASDRMPSEASDGLPALDGVLSEASDGLPALDGVLSEASDGLPATDKVLSETSDGFTALDRALSEVSDALSALDRTLSEVSDEFTSIDRTPSKASDTFSATSKHEFNKQGLPCESKSPIWKLPPRRWRHKKI